MNVNIEFFVSEQIENLITCLNYKMDKVIYFGHCDDMTPEREKTTKKYLDRLCGINNVEFELVSQHDLYSIVERMKGILEREEKAGNQCFFDLTGGEDLILVAMGMVSKEYKIPMHFFDMHTSELYSLNRPGESGICELAEKRKIPLTLDDIIGFKGGIIDYHQQKASKSHLDEEAFQFLVNRMWEVAKDSPGKWTALSALLKECNKFEDSELNVSVSREKLKEMLVRRPDFATTQALAAYMERLRKRGVFKSVQWDNEILRFTYESSLVRECLHDAGCLLEFRTYYNRLSTGKYCDCRVGVHIDWDGVLEGTGMDVENEIDVMLLEGYTPVFISCKSGKVDQMALYELQTVTKRFGGKYAKMELVAAKRVSEGYVRRAEEMKILVNYEE